MFGLPIAAVALGMLTPTAPASAQNLAQLQSAEALRTAPLTFASLVEGLNRHAITFAIAIARDFVDVTYGDIQVTDGGGSVAVTDLSIWPEGAANWPDLGHGPDAEDCRIDIARIEGLAFGGLARMRAHFDVLGVSAPLTCLPVDAATQLRDIGYARLEFDRGSLAFDYASGSSALSVTLSLAAEDAAEIRLALDFGYAWVTTSGGATKPRPALRLDGAVLEVEDRGALAHATPFLRDTMVPVAMVGPMAEMGLRAALTDGGTRPMGKGATRFADEVGVALAAFLGEGGRLTMRAAPPEPIWIEPGDMSDPMQLIDALAPSITHSAAAAGAQTDVTPAMVALALSGAPLPDTARLAVAQALIDGIGAPYAPDAAVQALAPMLDAGNPAARRLIARAIESGDPAAAYSAALLGFGTADEGADLTGAAATLDRLEARLSLTETLALQAGARLMPETTLPAGGRMGLKSAARAAAEGRGAPRDYARAYLLASLAAAHGDGAAAALRDRLDLHLTRRDAAIWVPEAARIQALSLKIWTSAVPQP
ncbi:MAG: TPR repeat protein [Paracoccaceae bacterium]|jgi:TPR repeat protein